MMSHDLQKALIESERARVRQLSTLIEILGEKGVLSEDQLKELDKLKPTELMDEYA